MSSDQREGAALVLLAAAGYACLPILAKWAYAAGLAPLDVVTWRFILATPLIWLVLLARRVPLRAPRLLRGRLLAVGLLFGILASTGFFALAHPLQHLHSAGLHLPRDSRRPRTPAWRAA